MFIFAFRVKKYSEQFQMASSSGQNITSASPAVTSQPISLVGSMGLVQNTGQQIVQNMNILQNPINVHQIAALQAQAQQRASAQQVQPVVVGNQHGVATLQNVQVLGAFNALFFLINSPYIYKHNEAYIVPKVYKW